MYLQEQDTSGCPHQPAGVRRAKLKRIEAAPNGTFQVNGVQCHTNGKAARRILEY